MSLSLLVLPLFFVGSCLQANEVKELGKQLHKRTALLFNSQDLLKEEDLLSEADQGKTFNPSEKSKSSLEEEIVQAIETGRKIEAIDEAERFLQRSQTVIKDPSSLDTGLSICKVEKPLTNITFQTCEEAIARVVTVNQLSQVDLIPAVKENKKVCQGHIQNFLSKYPTKKSAEDLKKTIKKNIGSNIELLGVNINGRNVIASYKHKNPEVLGTTPENRIYTAQISCFNYKIQEKVLQEEIRNIHWEASDPYLLEYLETVEHCHLIGKNLLNEKLRTLMFRCEKGEDAKCQQIRRLGGVLIDKECVETDPEGECTTYRKTFEIRTQASSPKEYHLDGKELIPSEEFETISEVDLDFGEAISRLAALSEVPGNVEENTNLMEAEVFTGTLMKCKRGCSRDYLYDCCGDPKGWLLGNGASCTKDEERLWQNRKAKKCHYIGTRDLKFGIEKEQVYICYPNILSRTLQEGARSQLGISWGTPEKPKVEGVKLKNLLEVDLEKIDFSDFEVEMKRTVDPEAIQKKIQSSIDSINPSQAKNQTDYLLREDKKKCDF